VREVDWTPEAETMEPGPRSTEDLKVGLLSESIDSGESVDTPPHLEN
jgi:hypothetical protein